MTYIYNTLYDILEERIIDLAHGEIQHAPVKPNP